MKVFLSWSGEESRELANVFGQWFPIVLQNIEVFFSPEDISKGEFWTQRIKNELKNNVTGIIFLTPDNVENPWIMFEAGALSNGLGKGKVFPLLFNMKIKDLNQPLALFNSTEFSKTEIKKLIDSINSDFAERKIDDTRLNMIFNKFWDDLETEINNVLRTYSKKVQSNVNVISDSELIRESLEIQKQVLLYLSQQKTLDYNSNFSAIENQLALIRNNTEKLTTNLSSGIDYAASSNRPKVIDCQLHRITINEVGWLAFVGKNKLGLIIEIFLINPNDELFPIPNSIKIGKLIKNRDEKGRDRIDFQYIDRYGYNNTLGGLNYVINSDLSIYQNMLNIMLLGIPDVKVVVSLLNKIKIKDNASFEEWKKVANRILTEK